MRISDEEVMNSMFVFCLHNKKQIKIYEENEKTRIDTFKKRLIIFLITLMNYIPLLII